MMDPAIVIAVVGAFASFLGSYLLFRTAKAKNSNDYKIAQDGLQADAKAKLDARIDERVAEQIEAAWEAADRATTRADKLEDKVKDLEKELRDNRKHMEASEVREAEMYGYIQELAAHILERKDPPPPTMPVNLVEHFSK